MSTPHFYFDVVSNYYVFADGVRISDRDMMSLYGNDVDLAYSTVTTVYSYSGPPVNYLPPGVTIQQTSPGVLTAVINEPPAPKTCTCGTYNKNHWADCSLLS